MFSYVSPRIKWLGRHVSGKIILDVGFAGSYRTAAAHQAMRKANPGSLVVALDIDRRKVFNYHLQHAIVGSGFSLPIKANSIDALVLAEILEHVSSWRLMLKEANRVLKMGGRVFVTTPNPLGIFRYLKHWLFSTKPNTSTNIASYLGAPDHLHFIEPLSLLNALSKLHLKPSSVTTTNLSIPYFPKFIKDPELDFWPFNRWGTYLCIEAQKVT